MVALPSRNRAKSIFSPQEVTTWLYHLFEKEQPMVVFSRTDLYMIQGYWDAYTMVSKFLFMPLAEGGSSAAMAWSRALFLQPTGPIMQHSLLYLKSREMSCM